MTGQGSHPGRGVALAGFMGVGKSTVAPLLGARLGLPSWDLDRRIEQEQARSIRTLFAEVGEPEFRTLEANALRRGVRRGAAVVSLGGGALLANVSRVLLQELGWVVVVLSAPWPVLQQRIATSDRPLAPQAEGLYLARQMHYAGLGVEVDTEGLSPVGVADRVLAALHRNGWETCSGS